MKKIEVLTVYENVDDEFIEMFIEKTHITEDLEQAFRQGGKLVFASSAGEVTAVTTQQLVEEFEQ